MNQTIDRSALWLFLSAALLLLVSCGGGGGRTSVLPGSEPSIEPSSTPTSSPSPLITSASAEVFISGSLTYDFVPHGLVVGLDYGATSAEPIRGVLVQLLDQNDTVVSETISNDQGLYELGALRNTLYKVRVLAELRRDQQPSWQFKVTDNTDQNSAYSLSGSLISSGSEGNTRDLHAASGWSGSAYTLTRVAAPFAILDSVYSMLDVLIDAGLDQAMPPAELRWSPQNRALDGNNSNGDIGTSHFDTFDNAIYLLGDADNDSDEYDASVVQHELFHFLEATLSRSESIGGSHTRDDQLDMRTAYSEGTANAFAAFIAGDGVFRDSGGLSQAGGFFFSLESKYFGNVGWYSEASIGNLVYDLLDNNSETGDELALGLSPVLASITSDEFINSPALSNIYLLLDVLKASVSSSESSEITQLAQSYNIDGLGIWAEGESHNAGSSLVLPIYHSASLGDTLTLCTRASSSAYHNKFETRRFIRLSLDALTVVNVRVTTAAQTTGDKDPDVVVFTRGQRVLYLASDDANREEGQALLTQGEHVIEVYDYDNTQSNGPHGSACFDIAITEV
ncbi:carboxypeptidase-like regulatory domain-containing protein [Agaribacterium sp. ZY112]|uniref:carboxypeptidase-like regulatory domain-containing protein n=1 Tax=Agaribacterium sp. ZY112 TaxID=3233574 RepID=UPI0035263A0C